MLRLSPVASQSLMPAAVRPKTPAPQCPTGYTMSVGGGSMAASPGAICLSPGCIDGKSKCVAQDIDRNTCSYDSLAAYFSSTGIKKCPTPGSIAPEESGLFINPSAPGSVPIPGTQRLPPNGSQPPPNGLPGQSTQPGITITPTDLIAPVTPIVPPGYTQIFGSVVPTWWLWGGALVVGAGVFFGYRKHHKAA